MKTCAPVSKMQVEIVLEARVYHPQFHDGFQFLSNDRFAAICPQLGCRHAEQNGERDFFRGDAERISETNVHLQRNDGIPNLRAFNFVRRIPAYSSRARMSSVLTLLASNSTPSLSTSARQSSRKTVQRTAPVLDRRNPSKSRSCGSPGEASAPYTGQTGMAPFKTNCSRCNEQDKRYRQSFEAEPAPAAR